MRTVLLCSIFLIGIAGAELITALVNPVGGVIFYFVLLFSLILSSAVVGRDPSHKLYLALALVPLMRILSFSTALAEFSEIYWYLLTGIPLLVGILVVIRILNLHPRDVGLTAGTIPFQGLIALTGIGLGLVEYLILRPEPLIPTLTWQEIILPALILLVVTGFVEELAFRGVMQHSSMQALGSWGWVYIAVLFSVLQIGLLSAIHWLVVLLIALLFGWIVKRTGSILGVSLCHGLTNVGLYLIFPFVIQL